MGLIEKYTPKSALADFTHDTKLVVAASGYTRGTLTRPLLLHGAHGTGKTAFALALAGEIRPEMHPSDITMVDVSSDTSIDAIRRLQNLIPGLFPKNPSGVRVVILDEVDNFSRQAMDALKGYMTKYPSVQSGVFFILTTNHINSISAPVQDRCKVVHMSATSVDDVLPTARTILTGEGVTLSDDAIRAALTKDSSGLCSYREMYGVIEEIITRLP